MIYILLLVSVGFLAINLHITKHDYMNPAVIFCGVFAISEVMCLLFRKAYAISFHYKTMIVLAVGFSVFTLLNYLVFKKKTEICAEEMEHISVPDWMLYVLIVLQVIAIVAFLIYLNRISVAYDGKARNLGEMINLYDTMTKFWRKKFLKLDVPIPLVYRVLNPFVHLGGYLSVYMLINNWFTDHKPDIRCMISIVLLMILIFLNGSRSPILRIITMVIALVYIMGCRSSRIQPGNLKTLKKILLFSIPAVIVLILMVKVIRPNARFSDLGDYLFIYAGAPLVNLNTWLKKFSGAPVARFFGEQTFRHIYNYIGKWTGNRTLESYDSINGFAFSANGKEIGNVYTCFYYLLFDFSYIGMAAMIGIMAYYYIREYRRALYKKSLKPFDVRLFIYAYLFNDLIMSFFSTRFYETVCSPEFIKFICAIIFVTFIYDKIKTRMKDNRINLIQNE